MNCTIIVMYYLQLFVFIICFCICFISGNLCKQVCEAFKVTLIKNKVYKQTNLEICQAQTVAFFTTCMCIVASRSLDYICHFFKSKTLHITILLSINKTLCSLQLKFTYNGRMWIGVINNNI